MSMIFKVVVVGVAASFLVLGIVIYRTKKSDPKPTPDIVTGVPTLPEYNGITVPSSCMAGVDEICPTADWYRDYQKLMALNAKYKIPQDQQDYINGLLARLRQAIPQGYDWNEDKRKFVKKPVAPPPVQGAKK